ncbi:unnamed protein product [Caenorhabditis nigoni]
MSNSSSPSLENVQTPNGMMMTTYSLQQQVRDLEYLLQKKDQQLYEKNMEIMIVKGQKLMKSRRPIQKESIQKRMAMRDCTFPNPTSDFDSINASEEYSKQFTSEEIRELSLERMEDLSKIAREALKIVRKK